MNVLQFGYGGQGKRHEQAWKQLGIEPFIIDPNQGKGWLGGWKLEDPCNHLVDIVTPADSHYTLVAQALEAKVPIVFCEKPLSPFVSDVENLLAYQGDTKVFVGYGYRFVPGMERLKAHLAEKGTPRYLKLELSALKRARSDLNTLWADGSHLYDLANYLGIEWNQYWEKETHSTDKTYTALHRMCNGSMAIEATSILPGASGDPHVSGAKGTKRITVLHRDYTLETLDFSSTDAVSLLVTQFQKILDGEYTNLHTLEESVALTKFLSEVG